MYRAKAAGQGPPRGVRRADAPRTCSRGSTWRPTCVARSRRQPAGAVPADPAHRDAPRSAASRRSAAGRSTRADFVAIAEETGLIVPLGALRAARGGAARRRVGRLRVGQRLGPPARRPRLRARASRRRCAASGARPGDLRLEVTESAMTQDPEARAADADATCATGSASTAHLDDFGTGASSLRFLHRFPGDALKIDRGLVIDMLTDPGSLEIVKAIVGLAHNLGMEVVGEGVRDRRAPRAARGARRRARAGLLPLGAAHRRGGGATARPADGRRRRARPGDARRLTATGARTRGRRP